MTYIPYSYESPKENGNSLVTRITYGENSFLLTGDATRNELIEIEQTNPGALISDLFKNPHHNQVLALDILLTILPKITIFSTSNGAPPYFDYLQTLYELGSAVGITSDRKHGNIFVSSDGKTIDVITQFKELFLPTAA